MGTLTQNLIPSLLIFGSIGFSLFISLPRLRAWFQERYDNKVKLGVTLDFKEYFTLEYGVRVLKFADPLAGIYIFSVILILFHPLYYPSIFGAYWLILVATTYLAAHLIIEAVRVHNKCVEMAKVTL